jgi:hypothetical protein
MANMESWPPQSQILPQTRKIQFLPVECCFGPHYNAGRLHRKYKKEATMAGTRKVIDCRRFPAEKPCSITISGTEDEVLELAVLHAGTVHGHNDTPEFRQQLRTMIEDENSTEVAAA